MSTKLKLRAAVLAVIALCATVFAAPVAHAADARYEGISEAGGVAVFSTTDKLVSGDTDNQRDVYARDFEEGLGYVTRAVSLGPTGGNDAYAAQFLAIDPAGEEIFFSTRERLTSDDKDSAEDIYVRDLGESTTGLVSVGAASCAASGCGNANVDASAAAEGIVDGGDRVFFVSSERLAAADSDASPDVYLRDREADTTLLVSAAGSPCAGSCGSGAQPVVFQGASVDGTKAIFTTVESLFAADSDAATDLYERELNSSETKLVSTPGSGSEPCPAGKKCEPVNSHIARSGAHVFFETIERIAASDSDASQDVYDWSAGTANVASVAPASGNGIANALYKGSSADGSRVFFSTVEALLGSDTDSAEDVYVRSAGVSTELVSAGDPSCAGSNCGNGSAPASLEWVSADGSMAILSTAEALTAGDGDGQADVYSRALPGGPTVLVSRPGMTCTDPECGDGDHSSGFAGSSADGTHLFFVTDEALVPPVSGDPSGQGDADEQTDVYERSGGTTTLVSLGQPNEVGTYRGNEAMPAQLRAASAEGTHAFFTTDEQLTEADPDGDEDLYMRSEGVTRLVSRGNDSELEAELAPPGPVLVGTDPESPDPSTSPRVFGFEPVEALIKLYPTADCSGEPVATGSAEELEEPGIEVTVAAGSTTTFRATAEAGGFISSCSGVVTYTQNGSGSSSGGGVVSKPSKKVESSGLIPIVFSYETPQTRITFGPASKTRMRRPVFRFTDSTGQPGTKFTCRVDRQRWQSCGSPIKLQKLSRGKHVFRVKGVNAVGVWQEKPTKRSFKLVTSK